MSTNIEFTPPTGAPEPVKKRRDRKVSHTDAGDGDTHDNFEKLMVLDYVRKPLYVRAVRVTESNMMRVATWCGGRIERSERGGDFIRIATFQPHNERQSKALVGDWVTMTENNSVKSYDNKAFRRTFQLREIEELEVSDTIKNAPEKDGVVFNVAPKSDEVDEEKLLLKYLAKKILED